MRNHSLMLDHPVGDPMGGVRAGGRVFQDPISTVLQVQAQGRAAKKAENATRESNALQNEQWQQVRQDSLPLMDLRNAVLPRIQQMANQDVGVTPEQVMAEPGYQFGLDEGRKALQGSAAARGGLYSGATLKALNRYGTDYAAAKFGDAFNRQQTQLGNAFNRANAAAGLGQAGFQQSQAAGSAYANNVGQNLLSNANFQAAAGMAKANTWANMLNKYQDRAYDFASQGMKGGF